MSGCVVLLVVLAVFLHLVPPVSSFLSCLLFASSLCVLRCRGQRRDRRLHRSRLPPPAFYPRASNSTMTSSTAAVKEWVASSHRTCDKGSSPNSPAYTRIPIWYRSVGKRACSASFLEEFFSETQGMKRGPGHRSSGPLRVLLTSVAQDKYP